METTVIDLRPACDALARVVLGIRDDRLDGPTPCPAYTVGDLLDHVDGLALAFTAAARRQPLAGPADPSGDGARLGPDWRARIRGRLVDLAEAWRDPTAYAGLTMAGPVEMPGDQAALVALDEVVLHGWDLARATGQELGVDREALEACLGFVTSFAPPSGADADGGLFGPPVPVPADAPVLDRLVGAAGRDPAWRPR